MLFSLLIVVAVGALGMVVKVPYVSLGPGPTYDTLSELDGTPLVTVNGTETFDTGAGQLRMTTVNVNNDLTLFEALSLWASGRYALAPREDYIKPGQTEDDIDKQNTKAFQDSQTNAEVAALRHLGFPVKVIAQEVTTGAPADGVVAPGDRIVDLNGKKINAQEDVRAALTGTTPGSQVAITVQHESQLPVTKTITLAKATDFGADERAEGFIGLGPTERADVPFTTKIVLDKVGGPSAGLMFALAIVDRLTPGELSDGRTVAGTGEITSRGEVGPIGGIQFKLVAAKEAGASVFLVPKSNCAEAKAAAPDGLTLVRVETLDGAVSALEDIDGGREVPSC